MAMPRRGPVRSKLGERQGWMDVGTLGQGVAEMDVEAELESVFDEKGT